MRREKYKLNVVNAFKSENAVKSENFVNSVISVKSVNSVKSVCLCVAFCLGASLTLSAHEGLAESQILLADQTEQLPQSSGQIPQLTGQLPQSTEKLLESRNLQSDSRNQQSDSINLQSESKNLRADKVVLPGCDLENLYQIDEGVYRSDQPSAADFKVLEANGLAEVLNLRNRHSDEDEAAGTGLRLHRVRMKAHAVSERKLIEALRIIKERKGPILIHCYHGSDRTGAVCALYRIVFQNVPKEQAIEEMVKGGFGFHRYYRNLIRRIRKADIERIRQEIF